MRVRTTIFLLLLLLGTAFVAGLVEVQRVEAQKYSLATASLEENWRASVDVFWENQGAQLAKLVEEFHDREGVLRKILENDAKWAEATWDTQSLASFDANALWVYRKDGTLFYSHANTASDLLRILPATVAPVEKIFAHDRAPHFYFELAAGGAEERRVVEVRGLPVRAPWDRDREAADGDKGDGPDAFLLAGRIWSASDVRSALPPGNDCVTLQFASETNDPETSSAGRMKYTLPLRDSRGRDVARLLFTNENSALTTLESRGSRVFVTLLIGAIALFVALYLLLSRTVVHPLRLVIHSLHSEDLSLLAPLQKQKAEFGELARLISTFFQQQTSLVREMRDRIAAEKALRESEEMLRHSQKMEAVGRLAGGVAHDFNNLLTAIIGYADLLRQRFAGDAAARQPAELIHQAGEQAAGLTRQLLAFSRKQLLQPKVIDLNTIVGNLQRLLQRIIGEHIEIRTFPEADPACVKADPGQIEQVIVNLGVNARDAMPRGGQLTMRTRNVVIGAAGDSSELPPGEYVALDVTDTGEGMDAETKARLFEPFFTTKGPGKGTGLGLATVYGIVRQSHGGIVVESERGSGSTFRILLPKVDASAEIVESAVPSSSRDARGETILIVEDEPIVRDLVVEVLRGHGYRVLASGSGQEAIELVRNHGGAIDLLISDVVMPEMNGAEVARCIHEIAPKARVLFVSGYSENDMADQGLEALAFQVLQKPFTPETLARKVREVLDDALAGPG